MFLEASLRRIYSIKKLFCIALLLLIFPLAGAAQIDPTFNPVPSNTSSFSGGFAIQPDGKIIIYGNFQIVQGVQKNGIARLNADGSLDNSFSCAACDFSIGSAIVQSDGKIVIAGAKAGGGSASRLRRLNADGSIDGSFASPFSEQPDGFNPVNKVWAVQPDGKIFVSQHFQFMGDPWSYLYRLNPTGAVDNSFARLYFNYGISQSGPKNILLDLKLMPDGRLMIGGKHDFGFLFRVNTDGTKDTSFVSPTLTNIFPQIVPYVESFDIQADGKIPLVGNFSSINGVSKNGMARLNADQSVETSYTFPLSSDTTSQTRKVQLQSDGKLLISGPFAGRIVRLNTDASLDNSFNAPANLTTIRNWKLDAGERILVSAVFANQETELARLNTDGSRDPSFNVSFGVAPDTIYSTAVQADGKILMTGDFSQVNGIVRQGFARLNVDGSLDNSFDPGSGFNRDVYQLVTQPDGKILAVGIFVTYNGTPRNSFARINADGSLDTEFNPTVANVAVAAVQADGKILIGGSFTTVNGTARTGLARLNADGSLDNSFNPTLGGEAVALTILVQADGKIMVGGIFSSVNGATRQNLARLNADGTLDTSFDAGSNSEVRILDRQADGKYLISERNIIYRRNADGSADSSFQSIDFDNQFSIRWFIPQTDGTIIVGGFFTRVGNDLTKAYLVRLAPNGTLQTDFLPGGIDARVWSLSKQADNKIIVAGEFTSIGGTTRLGIARLFAPSARPALYDFDGDGKADVSVFRQGEGNWYITNSSNNSFRAEHFGANGDAIAPGDYDGDGKTDTAVFRPSNGYWYILNSSDNSVRTTQFGQSGDLPATGDFDGDGKSDIALFRPSAGTFYLLYSSDNSFHYQQWGTSGDVPLIGDYDGDEKNDFAVFRPSSSIFYVLRSSDGAITGQQWGTSGDKPLAADFDGDGKTDIAVYRPSTAGWYYLQSSDNGFKAVAWGTGVDIPVAGDYDGDRRWDVAVFRPSTGTFYILQSTNGSLRAEQFGANGDMPVPAAFVP